MPSYELALLTRTLSKPDIVGILKRTANSIFDCGGFIRSIENLGRRPMPFKTSIHGVVHREANYFILLFDAPPSKLDALKHEYNRDVDIIRSKIYKVQPEDSNHECNIQEEMKPAPYRSEVIKMMEEIKKKEERRPKFKYNTGFDYYPFQK
ncbi:small ribosomal subunit protein bS6m [Halyomorpha halys]|uniref:small ribosomal subunit protein bS6m n=1 Tax=Halyomorpha halys TaxID=286706 RepID=UPI0006D517F6|nr:probable 28S ribosomal protein S6, mitochondrial [Halyomorpha halys]